MKYKHKCTTCNKQATKKFKGRWFCDDCCKEVKRHKKIRFVWAEKFLFSIGKNTKVYTDVPVKLKEKKR